MDRKKTGLLFRGILLLLFPLVSFNSFDLHLNFYLTEDILGGYSEGHYFSAQKGKILGIMIHVRV